MVNRWASGSGIRAFHSCIKIAIARNLEEDGIDHCMHVVLRSLVRRISDRSYHI